VPALTQFCHLKSDHTNWEMSLISGNEENAQYFEIPEGLKRGNSIPILNELAWNSLDECIKVQILNLSNQVMSSNFNSHVSIGEIHILMVLKNSISTVANHIVYFHSIEKNFDSLKRLIRSRLERLKKDFARAYKFSKDDCMLYLKSNIFADKPPPAPLPFYQIKNKK